MPFVQTPYKGHCYLLSSTGLLIITLSAHYPNSVSGMQIHHHNLAVHYGAGYLLRRKTSRQRPLYH